MKNTLHKIVFALTTALLALGCSPETPEEDIVISELRIEPASITLTVGDTYPLKVVTIPAYDNLSFEWVSVNPNIVSVDEDGTVEALAAGTAQVRCYYGTELSAKATVKVEKRPTPPEDEPDKPTDTPSTEPITFSSPLSKEMIFSSRQLVYPGTVMQSFDFYGEGENDYIYFSQCAIDSATGNKWLVVVSRVKRGAYGDSTPSGEAMKLRWFGHGTNICVEHAADGEDYIWINSNGTLSGTSYTNNKTIARVRFQPNTTFEHYTGEQFYLNSFKDAAGKSYTVSNLQPSIDFDSRHLLLTASASGKRYIIVYDLDQVLALKEESVTLTRTWGGETGTNTTQQKSAKSTISARTLDSLTPIGSFKLDKYVNADPTYTKTWSTDYQGHAIRNGKIYWYEGTPIQLVEGSGVYDGSCAYVETFDFEGNRVAPRAKIYAASDFTNMFTLLDLNKNLYSEAEGIQVKADGKIYLGITTHIAGKTSGNRRSTILRYDKQE